MDTKNLFDGMGFGKNRKKPVAKMADVVEDTQAKDRWKRLQEGERRRMEEERRRAEESDEERRRRLREETKLEEEERRRKEKEDEEKRLSKLEEELKKKEKKTKVVLKDTAIQVDEPEDNKKSGDDLKPVTLHVHVHEDGQIETRYEIDTPSPTNSPHPPADVDGSTNSAYKFNRKFNDTDVKMPPSAAGLGSIPVIITPQETAKHHVTVAKPAPEVRETVQKVATVVPFVDNNPYKNKYQLETSEDETESEPEDDTRSRKSKSRARKPPKPPTIIFHDDKPSLPQRSGKNNLKGRSRKVKATPPEKQYDWETKIAQTRLKKNARTFNNDDTKQMQSKKPNQGTDDDGRPVNVIVHYHTKEPQVPEPPPPPVPSQQQDNYKKKKPKKGKKGRRRHYSSGDSSDADSDEEGGKVVHIHHHHYYNTPPPDHQAQQQTNNAPVTGPHGSRISDTVDTKMGPMAISRKFK